MFPRNLQLFRFAAIPHHDIAAALAEHPIRDVGPQEMATNGFVSPYRTAHGRMTVETPGFVGFVFEQRKKLLPDSSVIEAVRRKVEKIATEEGRKIGGRERKRMREDVLTEMLPHAPVRTTRTAGWLDLAEGWLIVDAANRGRAESALSALREAFGSFPAVPLAPEESPRVLATDWLANDTMPAGVALGDECELRDPSSATGSIARMRRQELDAEEVREHLRNGKQVFQLGLVYDDRLAFVLGEDLSLRRVKPLDIVLDALGDQESHEAEIESRFGLATLEVRRLLDKLQALFNIPRPAEG